ncbi:MAG: MotA/TolQ/ExbB proton channel family protein [Anaerohalosphaeraceae bacterium]|nr:MotA/TolQ/ExbB proton channel family protein [Anaerohalosphaeraceae bacterium]
MSKNSKIKIITLIVALAFVCALAGMLMKKSSGSAEVASEKTFFTQFVLSGGPIVWFVLLPLSIVMIHLTLSYCFIIRRKKLLPKNFGAGIIKHIRNNGCGNLTENLSQNKDMVSAAVSRAAMYMAGSTEQIHLQLQLQNVVSESLEEQSLRLIRKIEWVGIIGNISPMIGLFGTVFGMIKLFNSIVISGGSPRPEQMADGISVALVTTFWGLLIAIPALGIHSIFKNNIESIVAEAAVETEMIIVEIKKSVDGNSNIGQGKNES